MSDEAKIPTSEELLALADRLEADNAPMSSERFSAEVDAAAALRALAAPKPAEPTREAEPVAWMYEKRTENMTRRRWQRSDARCSHLKGHGWTETPLYDAPALAAARAEGERAMRDRASKRVYEYLIERCKDEAIDQSYSANAMLDELTEIVAALPVPDLSPRPAEEVEAAVLAERGNYEAFSDFHDQQWMEAINYAADVELIETNAFIRAWREGSCEEHADPLGEWAAFRQWREAQRARTAPAKEVGRG